MRFRTWLYDQKKRGDNVGELATFAFTYTRDDRWPVPESLDAYTALFESLREYSATYQTPNELPKLDALRRSLDRAWYEWRAALGGQRGEDA